MFGLPYKIFVCAVGFVVAMLSVTGIYIWWKKRAALAAHVQPAPAQHAPAE
ncbi:PepSY domain-containing protein [Methylocystis sp. 9N]|uniref:PepSY domain-containing protein n=1 Tax=Methylocystis borbori TaxID=3118750 RepID=A0ABU7XD80_9HYPH